jgi:hypothetical protein
MLADVEGKQAQLSQMEEQYRAQLSRVVEFAVYRDGDVGNALSLMSEIQAKLNEVLQTSEHLGMIGRKAGAELEVLLLTKRVAEARSQLTKLEERQQALAAKLAHLSEEAGSSTIVSGGESSEVEDIKAIYEEVETEIARLHTLITDASERAARSIHSRERQHA